MFLRKRKKQDPVKSGEGKKEMMDTRTTQIASVKFIQLDSYKALEMNGIKIVGVENFKVKEIPCGEVELDLKVRLKPPYAITYEKIATTAR